MAAAINGPGMRSWLIALFVTVACATAWAQSSPLADTTTRAWNASAVAEGTLSSTSKAWSTINVKFRAELDAAQRLKNSPKSWRRDRELRAKLADAEALGRQLESASADVRRATEQLAAARRTLIAAIDAELASNPGASRKTQLDSARAQVLPKTQRVARIVLPDMQIDPLADPEELAEHIEQLLESEEQLRKQMVGLDKQAKDLDEVAKLRKQHDRAGELSRRDDDQPQRTASQGGGRGATAAEGAGNDSPAPEAGGLPPTGGDSGGGTDLGTTSVGTFESEATIVLADVIDATTIETLTRAQRTGDPAQRAVAAKKARDAVAGRLEQLRKKRAELEALTKSRQRR